MPPFFIGAYQCDAPPARINIFGIEKSGARARARARSVRLFRVASRYASRERAEFPVRWLNAASRRTSIRNLDPARLLPLSLSLSLLALQSRGKVSLVNILPFAERARAWRSYRNLDRKAQSARIPVLHLRVSHRYRGYLVFLSA